MYGNGIDKLVRYISVAASEYETLAMNVTLIEFDAGDYIQLRVRHRAGHDLDIMGYPEFAPVFWCYRIALPT